MPLLLIKKFLRQAQGLIMSDLVERQTPSNHPIFCILDDFHMMKQTSFNSMKQEEEKEMHNAGRNCRSMCLLYLHIILFKGILSPG